jgi:hypothetical protein
VWGFQRDGFAAPVWEIPALGSLLAWTVRKRRRTVAAVLDSDQITGIIPRAVPPGLEGRVDLRHSGEERHNGRHCIPAEPGHPVGKRSHLSSVTGRRGHG